MSILQVNQSLFIAAIRREAMEEAARITENAPSQVTAVRLIRERAKQQTQENTNASDQSKT